MEFADLTGVFPRLAYLVKIVILILIQFIHRNIFTFVNIIQCCLQHRFFTIDGFKQISGSMIILPSSDRKYHLEDMSHHVDKAEE